MNCCTKCNLGLYGLIVDGKCPCICHAKEDESVSSCKCRCHNGSRLFNKGCCPHNPKDQPQPEELSKAIHDGLDRLCTHAGWRIRLARGLNSGEILGRCVGMSKSLEAFIENERQKEYERGRENMLHEMEDEGEARAKLARTDTLNEFERWVSENHTTEGDIDVIELRHHLKTLRDNT